MLDLKYVLHEFLIFSTAHAPQYLTLPRPSSFMFLTLTSWFSTREVERHVKVTVQIDYPDKIMSVKVPMK